MRIRKVHYNVIDGFNGQISHFLSFDKHANVQYCQKIVYEKNMKEENEIKGLSGTRKPQTK